MRNRKLSLKREALAELTTPELGAVAGGQAITYTTCNLTDRCTHGGSFDAACPTLPVNECRILTGVYPTDACGI